MKIESMAMMTAAATLCVGGVLVFDTAALGLRVLAVCVAVGAGALAAFLWRV